MSSTKSSNSVSAHVSLVADRSKRISLLFGILLILTVYGLAESIKMLYIGRRASLIELIIFALLAADAIVLFMTAGEKNNEEPGLLQYMSVWVLGLIPYFGWAVVYWLGKGIADILQQNLGNTPIIALLLFIGIIILCLCVYLFVSG